MAGDFADRDLRWKEIEACVRAETAGLDAAGVREIAVRLVDCVKAMLDAASEADE